MLEGNSLLDAAVVLVAIPATLTGVRLMVREVLWDLRCESCHRLTLRDPEFVIVGGEPFRVCEDCA